MKVSKPIILFYVVVTYVFASYIWWSYLLADKNMLAYEYHLKSARLEYNVEHDLPKDDTLEFSKTAKYKIITDRYDRQRFMIVGEGAVFLLLLALGAYSVRRFLMKEIALARQQRNFMLSITHELKSPLASIKLSLQTFVRRITLEDKFQKLLNNSLSDIDRLENLVDNILLAAKVEDAGYKYDLQVRDISVLIEDVLLRCSSGHGEKWQWQLDIKPDVQCAVDEMPFVSTLLNLVENAMKYSPEGTTIGVNLTTAGNKVQLAVSDEGPGIPHDEKPLIFDKFYRVGNEETRSAKGTGLGLFIVKGVVQNHGGSITVADNKPQGTIFTIILPKAG